MVRWLSDIWYKLTLKLKKENIRMLSARISGDGSFVDVRYWITRPDKLPEKYNICLIDEITKEKLLPANFIKFGAMKTKHGKKKNRGFALFFNRNKSLKAGSKVILTINGKLSIQAEISK